jgi:WNK lysine deficient protein kinase
VYRGYDHENGCEVAWNVIKLNRLPQNERRRISEEINILKHLKHQNIIGFVNAWVSRQRNEVVFITECASGGSLKRHLRRIRKPRLKIIRHWSREILLGLEYLHN